MDSFDDKFMFTNTSSQEDADVYPNGDAYVIVFSVIDYDSFDDAIEILNEFQPQQKLQKSAVILVGYKLDVVKQRTVSKESMLIIWIVRIYCYVLYSSDCHLLNR